MVSSSGHHTLWNWKRPRSKQKRGIMGLECKLDESKFRELRVLRQWDGKGEYESSFQRFERLT